jgi:hypothetical protein
LIDTECAQRLRSAGIGELEIFEECNIHSIISNEVKLIYKHMRMTLVTNEYMQECLQELIKEMVKK